MRVLRIPRLTPTTAVMGKTIEDMGKTTSSGSPLACLDSLLDPSRGCGLGRLTDGGGYQIGERQANRSQRRNRRRPHPRRSQPMIERTVVSRQDWLHGLVPCPRCGLPLNADHDLVHEIRHLPNPRLVAVGVRHQRCGGKFQLELGD